MSTLAIVLAESWGTSLSVLSDHRAESAVPFAGKYRIIDFVLSNCANSGVSNVGILTQYHPYSLNDHIRNGRPWDLDRMWSGGVTLLPPYQRGGGSQNWYDGTADAVFQNQDFILEHDVETVLLLPGQQVYKMDYAALVSYHKQRGADVTVCGMDVLSLQQPSGNYLVADEAGRVLGIQQPTRRSSRLLGSMGIYVFRTEILLERLTQDARSFASTHDLARDIIPQMLAFGDQIYAYACEGYWITVDSVQTFWQANMDLLRSDPPLKLQDPEWPIRTRSEEFPPANFAANASVSKSLISNGCIVSGRIENSVLSPGARICSGAIVRDSVIFNGCVIGSDAVVNQAILDKNVVVGANAYIGGELGISTAIDGQAPGIAVVARDTHLPAGICVGPNRAIKNDLKQDVLVNGQTAIVQHGGLRPAEVATEFTFTT